MLFGASGASGFGVVWLFWAFHFFIFCVSVLFGLWGLSVFGGTRILTDGQGMVRVSEFLDLEFLGLRAQDVRGLGCRASMGVGSQALGCGRIWAIAAQGGFGGVSTAQPLDES